MKENVLRKYQMSVWNEKMDAMSYFSITLLRDGWEIINPPCVGGMCDSYGINIEERMNPEGLIECFEQDYIVYPSNISGIFHGLYTRILSGEIDNPEIIQEKFNEIGKWITDLNLNMPGNISI